MGLFVPYGQDFKWQISSVSTRPAAAYGTSIIAGFNTMGSWNQLISSAQMVDDGYGILINMNSVAISATTRNVLLDVGIDNAGGTNYVVKIPYLMGGHEVPFNIGSGGIWYYFPLFIPKNSSIAVRAQASNTTSGFNCFINVFGQPRRPDAVRVGTKVYSFGETPASSSGTAITLGTTTIGNWTQAGSATPIKLWWWQVGFSVADTTMSAAAVSLDLSAGNATAKKIIFQGYPFTTTTAEQINNIPAMAACSVNVAPGDLMYVRGWSSTTPDTGNNIMVYGLGG